jgi:hypothetical protein
MTLNYELQRMVADEISHSASVAAQAWAQAGHEAEMAALQHKRPFMTLRPRMFPDGNAWCALYGENVQDGVIGFGETPAKAAESFDLAWLNEKAGIGLPAVANRSGVAPSDAVAALDAAMLKAPDQPVTSVSLEQTPAGVALPRADQLVEAVAKAIYSQWIAVLGYMPWVEGGNSFKQDDARRLAREAIDGVTPTDGGQQR